MEGLKAAHSVCEIAFHRMREFQSGCFQSQRVKIAICPEQCKNSAKVELRPHAFAIRYLPSSNHKRCQQQQQQHQQHQQQQQQRHQRHQRNSSNSTNNNSTNNTTTTTTSHKFDSIYQRLGSPEPAVYCNSGLAQRSVDKTELAGTVVGVVRCAQIKRGELLE
jgi:transcription initiation factor TFIID subunit TAF12